VNQVFSLSTPKETMIALEKLAKKGIQGNNENNDEEDSSSLKQWSEFTLSQMTKINSNTLEVSFFLLLFCVLFSLSFSFFLLSKTLELVFIHSILG
jgi:hypothetical protein